MPVFSTFTNRYVVPIIRKLADAVTQQAGKDLLNAMHCADEWKRKHLLAKASAYLRLSRLLTDFGLWLLR